MRFIVIAVDTNILVYAHRTDSPFHETARTAIQTLSAKSRPWVIPWPCAHEFFAIVTHRRIYRIPTPPETAITQLRALESVSNLSFIAESDGYLTHLESLAIAAKSLGGAIHDARIAAICLSNGVDELWSADRDFSRFPSLTVRNPLI